MSGNTQESRSANMCIFGIFCVSLFVFVTFCFIWAIKVAAEGPETLGSGSESGLTLGGDHSCAITSVGAVKCWGLNSYGQLGDGSLVTQSSPVDVLGLSSGVVAVSAGQNHTCAITSVGAVKCWGLNSDGQLGDGSLVTRLSPVDVVDLSSGVVAVSAGENYTCAITSVGAVKCWGENHRGQLGDNSQTNRLLAVDVVGLSNGVTAVSAGSAHTCAITSSGGAKCWGFDREGQLGDSDSISTSKTPVDVFGLTANVVSISVGFSHTCAITRSSSTYIYCWGDNRIGQVGSGPETIEFTPVYTGGFSTFIDNRDEPVAVSAGENHTCGLTRDGKVKCWGDGWLGQLGTTVNRNSQRFGFPYTTNIVDIRTIAVGGDHSCAINIIGQAKCWGYNESGELGNTQDSGWQFLPVDVSSPGTVWTKSVSKLSNLSLSSGVLSPVFSSGTLSYQASVGNLVSSVVTTGVAVDGTAQVVVSGGSSLVVGSNVVTVTVTAQDGVSETVYSVTVTRAAAAVTPVATPTTTIAPVITTTTTFAPVGATTTTTTVAPAGITTTTTTTTSTITTTTTTTAPKAITPTVRLSKASSAKSMATYAKMKVLSTSTVSLKVLPAYAKYCKVSGTTLKGVKAGTCKLTVIVTPKKGRATSKTVTLKVTK